MSWPRVSARWRSAVNAAGRLVNAAIGMATLRARPAWQPRVAKASLATPIVYSSAPALYSPMGRDGISMEIRQALTFDDVLLVPAAWSILPTDTDTRTRLTREVSLGIPLISAAMDTVTESALAIAMAQSGGLDVIHRNLAIAEQADEVRKVKKFEAGMVVNPVTISPDATLADALKLMADNRISGIPVVERRSQKPVGIVTNRGVRLPTHPQQPISRLMTKGDILPVAGTPVRRA